MPAPDLTSVLALLGCFALGGAVGWIAAIIALVRALRDPTPDSPRRTIAGGAMLLALSGPLAGMMAVSESPLAGLVLLTIVLTSAFSFWAAGGAAARLDQPSPWNGSANWAWIGAGAVTGIGGLAAIHGLYAP